MFSHLSARVSFKVHPVGLVCLLLIDIIVAMLGMNEAKY